MTATRIYQQSSTPVATTVACAGASIDAGARRWGLLAGMLAGGLAASVAFAGPTDWASQAGDGCRWHEFVRASEGATATAEPVDGLAEPAAGLVETSFNSDHLRAGSGPHSSLGPQADHSPATGGDWLDRLDTPPVRPVVLVDREPSLGTGLLYDDPELALVPLPPVVWAGLTVLGGLAVTRGLRRKTSRLPV